MTATVRTAVDQSPGGSLPCVALTLGDVAGIGPEVAVRAALDPQVWSVARPVLVGRPEIVERVLRQFSLSARLGVVTSMSAASVMESRDLVVLSAGRADVADVPPGTIDARAGQGAYDALLLAVDAAIAGQVAAVVTAPLHQESLRLAGINHPGHTEILAERCGVKSHAMMLHLPHGGMIQQPGGLSVAHVTLHTSLASVPGLLSVERIGRTIRLLNSFLRQLGIEDPRIGVCALNPHAGEHGLFGDEEATLIEPAVRAAVAEGVNVRGPYPADTLVRSGVVDGRYDGLVAMYHEQGHIPFKLIGFDHAVNVTLGLPIVRTSPSHGTAFDIAWRGIARSTGMCCAVATAAQLVPRLAAASHCRGDIR